MKHWRHVLLGLLALALTPTLHAANPCASGGAPTLRDGNGQGGTGVRSIEPDGSGQGGAGLSPGTRSDGDGSGTGGTGLTVEVEGVITGFASICVNGLELHYSAATPVTLHGKTATPRDLAVGQVVRALATGQGNQLAVQRVQVQHLLVATIQGINPGKLHAQGRTISLGPDAVLPSGLASGVKVAVSGFVGAQGHPVATRLDVVPGDTPDSFTGEVTRNAQGKLSIDGVVLEGRLSGFEAGDTVRAEGHFAQGRMHITRVERQERITPVDRVVIQGSIRHADKSGISIGNQRFLIDNQTRVKQALPRTGEWAIIDAVREGRQFHAREVDTQTRPEIILDRVLQRESSVARGAGHDGQTPDPEQKYRPATNIEHQNQAVEPSARIEPQEHQERAEKPEELEKIERIEKTERPERVETPEKIERIERPEKVEKPEKIERIERPEKVEKAEKIERIERPEKVEKAEKIERIERPEKVEKPEKIEHPEKIERVERPESPEHGD